MSKWTIEDYKVALRKCKDENAALKEQRDELYEQLRLAKDAGDYLCNDNDKLTRLNSRMAEQLELYIKTVKWCPDCRSLVNQGHFEYCKLAPILAEIRKDWKNG